jgi:uncharacterized repeat protein (TIGR02543 family)
MKASSNRSMLVTAFVCSALALSAVAARAEVSAPFPLDTRSGARIACDVETIAYSTEWNHGGSVRVTADGIVLLEAAAPASGEVPWNAAEAARGVHVLTHTSGGETLTATFSVGGAVATVTLGGLSQVYDGSAKTVVVETEPEGLEVAVTYDGSGEAPTEAGNHAVQALVDDGIWVGFAEGVLEIAKGKQTIEFAEIGPQTTTDTIVLEATASSGLAVSYAVDGPAVADGNLLVFTGEGTVRVTASQAGNGNWEAAEAVEREFEVAKAVEPLVPGISAPFHLDTRSGTRIAGETEAIAYSTEWNHGGSVQVAADGIVLEDAVAPASGEVAWNATEAGDGFHTLTHTSGGETLTAVFAVGQVATVTFDRQGGTGGTDSVLAICGIALPAVAVPSRPGYTFGGYFSEPDGEGTAYYAADGSSDRDWDIPDDTTLHAKWFPPQTVAFDANGGICGTATATYTVGAAYGELPDAVRDMYAFAGWWTAKSGGEQVTESTLVDTNAEQTLFAHWNPAFFTVRFNANGGKGTMADQSIKRNVATKLSASKFTRSGYTFMGWSKSKTGSVAYADKASVKNLAAAGGTATLYAQWAKTAYKVAFDANGGKGKMPAQAMTYGKAAKLAKNAFERKDYVFLGWAKSKTGAVAYANRESVKNLRTDGKTTTLYAKWAKKNYSVAFNANGGKGKMDAQAMTYGKASKLRKNAFTKKGYVFIGWGTAKKGPVAYADRQEVRDLRTDGKTTTLYAQWAKETSTVKFNANGGTVSPASKTVKYNAKIGSRPTPKRPGYKFAGWFTAKNGGTKVTETTRITADCTLYAHWTAAAKSAKRAAAPSEELPAEIPPEERVFSADDCGVFEVGTCEIEICPEPPEVEELAAREWAEELETPLTLTFRVPDGGAAWQLWSAERGTLADEGLGAASTVTLQLPDLGIWYWMRFLGADGSTLSSTWLFPAE